MDGAVAARALVGVAPLSVECDPTASGCPTPFEIVVIRCLIRIMQSWLHLLYGFYCKFGIYPTALVWGVQEGWGSVEADARAHQLGLASYM